MVIDYRQRSILVHEPSCVVCLVPQAINDILGRKEYLLLTVGDIQKRQDLFRLVNLVFETQQVIISKPELGSICLVFGEAQDSVGAIPDKWFQVMSIFRSLGSSQMEMVQSDCFGDGSGWSYL